MNFFCPRVLCIWSAIMVVHTWNHKFDNTCTHFSTSSHSSQENVVVFGEPHSYHITRPTSRTYQPLGATTACTQTSAQYTTPQFPKMPVISTTSDDLGSSNQLRYLTPGHHKRLGRTSSTKKSPDSLGYELRSCPRCSQTQSLILHHWRIPPGTEVPKTQCIFRNDRIIPHPFFPPGSYTCFKTSSIKISSSTKEKKPLP